MRDISRVTTFTRECALLRVRIVMIGVLVMSHEVLVRKRAQTREPCES